MLFKYCSYINSVSRHTHKKSRIATIVPPIYRRRNRGTEKLPNFASDTQLISDQDSWLRSGSFNRHQQVMTLFAGVTPGQGPPQRRRHHILEAGIKVVSGASMQHELGKERTSVCRGYRTCCWPSMNLKSSWKIRCTWEGGLYLMCL